MEQYLSATFPEAVEQAREMGAAIYFLDEASVRSDAHRGLTWGQIGETPVVQDSGGRFSLHVISAVSPRGDMRFSFIADRMNSKKFVAFLKKLRKDAGKPILVITDNARYHHSKETQRFIEQQEGDILLTFLPAYSPQLNPDEQVWNHAKARLGKRSIFSKLDMKRHLCPFFVPSRSKPHSSEVSFECPIPHTFRMQSLNLRLLLQQLIL